MKHPFLVGESIYLRGLEREDLSGNYFQWFNDYDVCKGNSHGYFPNNLKEMESYLDNIYRDNSLLVLAVICKEDNVHIGNFSLQNIDWISRSAEYAVIFGEKSYWGRGLAKEASDLLLHHGFVGLNLYRIYCGTFSNNVSMQKLALYMGMKQEGIRRKAVYKNGRYRDIVEYGILRSEYFEKNGGSDYDI